MKSFVDLNTYNSTNPFGQYDPIPYPLTKHHIGSDFRVAIKTPIFAPTDGAVIKAVFNPARGNTAVFNFTYEGLEWGMELCHLYELPELGDYKAGQQIALSGNTGSATTGPHLHIVMHKDALVSKNYATLTSEAAFVRLWRNGNLIDPYLYFWPKVD